MTERYQNSATIPITVTVLNSARAKVTGLTDVLLTIRRESDDQYFDFDDSSFKGSGWVDRDLQMGGKDATNSPGVYFYDWDTTGLSDDEYHLEISSATAANSPWADWVYVGDYVDNIDAPISGANTVIPDAAGTAPTAVENRQEMDSNSVDFSTIITALGTAGAGLTDLGGMSTTMKGQILTEVVKLLVTQLTESYAANGVAPTLAQAQFAIHQMLMQFGISGTSWTVRKLDDTTTAFVVLLDDGTNPTDAKRV